LSKLPAKYRRRERQENDRKTTGTDMSNSTANTLVHVLETLQDGAAGFEEAAGIVDDMDRPELAAILRSFAVQRAKYHSELKALMVEVGLEVSSHGSVSGALHRGWMGLKGIAAGDDPLGVLGVVEQGEEHAVSVYERACGSPLPRRVLHVLEQQFSEIRIARSRVTGFREAAPEATIGIE
jgi:uncharacterized protein (TIGR02284 family)